MSVENVVIPQQYVPRTQAGMSHEEILATARSIAERDMAVADNGTVYALVGNAHDPELQSKMVSLKGDKRGSKQPVGWTVPFSHSLDLLDVNRVEDGRMQVLLRDPHALSQRLGAIAFLRGPADMKRKAERGLPDCIIPENDLQSAVQIYSPTGSDETSRLVRAAMVLGAEPVMTSANRSGNAEIVTAEEARQFAHSRGLNVLVHKEDSEKPRRPKGSYPVIGVEAGRFVILRSGCFDPEIIKNLFSDYQVDEAPNMTVPKRAQHVLTVADLEAIARDNSDWRELPQLKNAELRAGLLAVVGWHADSWEIQKAAK